MKHPPIHRIDSRPLREDKTDLKSTESTFRCATTTHDLIRKCKKCINRLNLYSALDLHSSDIVNHGAKSNKKA